MEKKYDFKPPYIPIQRHSFFADEADITKSRFQLVGGTAIRTDLLESVYKRIWKLREDHGMFAELKWSKVSNQKYEAYKDLVDIFFDLMGKRVLSFHAATFDNHQWKHRLYNQNDADIGLSKNYYQLILHQYIYLYGDIGSLFVCLDKRLSTTPLSDLQRMLNSGAAKEYKLTYGPLTSLVARDSKKDDMLQMNDVILGAVSAHKNGRHLDANTRKAKSDLAKYVREKSGLKNYKEDSPRDYDRFTLWNRKPR